MQIGSRQFRPKLWPTLVTLALLPLLVSLGFWQLDRADQKEALKRQYEARVHAAPVNLADIEAPVRLDSKAMQWRRVALEGRYLPGKQFLLDNQVMGGRAGYLVYTPFQLRDRSLVVLINRGWVPAGVDRTHPPQLATPEGAVKLEGTVTLPPAPGIIFGDDQGEVLEDEYIRVQHLDPEQWDKDFSATLLPYAVRLDGENKEGFLRNWQPPGFGKEKHLGYAFQWFAMAVALVIIYIVVNLKKL